MTDKPILTGDLGALSLTGLAQLLSSEGRSGRLDLEAPTVKGTLWFQDGDLVHAEAGGGAAAEAALDQLAGLTQGRFSFAAGEAAPRRSLAGRTDQLLMESACRRDHVGHAPAEVPLEAIPAFAPVPLGGATPRFTTLQWQVLARIDGKRSVDSLASEVGLPATVLATLVRDLIAAGVLRLV
jgi:hypothetical protein